MPLISPRTTHHRLWTSITPKVRIDEQKRRRIGERRQNNEWHRPPCRLLLWSRIVMGQTKGTERVTGPCRRFRHPCRHPVPPIRFLRVLSPPAIRTLTDQSIVTYVGPWVRLIILSFVRIMSLLNGERVDHQESLSLPERINGHHETPKEIRARTLIFVLQRG